MRRALAPAMVVLAMAGGDVLSACGDKFFLIGRGDRFSRAYASLHPGNILVYTHGLPGTPKGIRDERLLKHLARAGHRVAVANDPNELSRILDASPVDIILTSLTQAPGLVSRVATLSSAPTLVPVAGEAEGPTPAGSSHRFTSRLKSSDKANRFLSEIEEAMKARASAGLWRLRS